MPRYLTVLFAALACLGAAALPSVAQADLSAGSFVLNGGAGVIEMVAIGSVMPHSTASDHVVGQLSSAKPIKLELDVYVPTIAETSASRVPELPTARVKGAACPRARPSRYAFNPVDEVIGAVSPKAGETEYLTTLYLSCGPGKLWLLGALRVNSAGKVTAGWWGVWEASRKFGPYRSCGGTLTPGKVGSEGTFSGMSGKPLRVRGTLRPYKGLCKPDYM